MKKYLHKIKTALQVAIKYLLIRFFGLLPINNNKIVFSSFHGKQYSDNPMYISRQLQQEEGLDVVWLLNQPAEIDGIRCVKEDSLRAVYELATARVWVDNCRKRFWMKKRSGQYYLQTWHGGVCLKQVEADTENTLPASYIKNAKNDSSMINAMVSECEWRTKNYQSAFWYNGEILKTGLPKSDLFFEDSTPYKNKICAFYSIPTETHIVLYAPTFRQDQRTDCYNLDTESLLKALKARFGGEWVCLFRLHPNASKLCTFLHYDERNRNGLEYSDMNEQLMAADVLVTDYSGCLFDGLHAGKKVFLFANDYEQYTQKERKLYFDIRTLPAPFTTDNDELTRAIADFDEAAYEKARRAFVSQMGYYGSGHSAETIAAHLMQKLQLKNAKTKITD